MTDFVSITSLKAAEDAWQSGLLIKTLLLPAELGGEAVPENIVYVPPHIYEIMRNSSDALIESVRKGISDIAVTPEYRGMSFVPIKIMVAAARPGSLPEYEFEIAVW